MWMKVAVSLSFLYLLIAAETPIAGSGSYSDEGVILPSCKVLSNLQDYRGKLIHVAGVLKRNDEEAYLAPGPKESCAQSLEIDGYRWQAPAFNLAQPGSRSVDDASAEPHASVPIPQISPNAEGEQWVIVAGRLETKPKLMVVHAASAAVMVPLGFGHEGTYPAQIVFSEVKALAK